MQAVMAPSRIGFQLHSEYGIGLRRFPAAKAVIFKKRKNLTLSHVGKDFLPIAIRLRVPKFPKYSCKFINFKLDGPFQGRRGHRHLWKKVQIYGIFSLSSSKLNLQNLLVAGSWKQAFVLAAMQQKAPLNPMCRCYRTANC